MKSVKKILAMCLAIMMIVSCIPAAHAADVPNTAIDLDAKGSLTLYKYDLTNAEKDGVWDSSYVSTGVYDENVNKTLGESKRAGDNDNSADLGNGEVSYGYAVKGVEFTYLRVGDIVQYTESANDGDADTHLKVSWIRIRLQIRRNLPSRIPILTYGGIWSITIKKSISMAKKGWIANLRMKTPVSFWLTTVWKAKSLP